MSTCRRPFFGPCGANKGARNGRFIPFCHLRSHFLDIEGHGEEGKVHGDLVLAEMPESLVLHVVLDLAEDRLWFYGAFRPVPKSSLRGQPLPCPAPVLHQAVVDINLPFSLDPPVAPPAERASLAPPRTVDGAHGHVAAVGPLILCADPFHVLAHRTDEIVFLRVVVQVLLTEDVVPEVAFLLLVEVVVLDVGLHVVRLHESVVLLAAIARVGADLAGHAGIPEGKGAEEGSHRERVPRIGEKAEVGDELALRAYLQVVARLGLPVVHRVLLHPHERGVGIGLAAGVAPVKLLQVAVILRELVRHLLQFPHLFPPLARGCLTLIVHGGGLLGERLAQFGANLRQHLRREADRLVRRGLVLGYRLVNLGEQRLDLFHEPRTVPLNRLAPDERVPVGLRLNLCAVDVLNVEGHQPLRVQQQDKLGEHLVDLILHSVAEAVDSDEVGLLVARKPDEVDVAPERRLNPAAGVDVVHVGVDDNLQKHPRVVGTTAARLVKPADAADVKVVDYGAH